MFKDNSSRKLSYNKIPKLDSLKYDDDSAIICFFFSGSTSNSKAISCKHFHPCYS